MSQAQGGNSTETPVNGKSGVGRGEPGVMKKNTWLFWVYRELYYPSVIGFNISLRVAHLVSSFWRDSVNLAQLAAVK